MRATNAGYQESTAELTSGEAQKEESKLMVWSAMLLLSAYTSNKVEFDQEYLPLFITDSPNVNFSESLHDNLWTLMFVTAFSLVSSTVSSRG